MKNSELTTKEYLESKITKMCIKNRKYMELYFKLHSNYLEYYTSLDDLEEIYLLYYLVPDEELIFIYNIPSKKILDVMIHARRLYPSPNS